MALIVFSSSSLVIFSLFLDDDRPSVDDGLADDLDLLFLLRKQMADAKDETVDEEGKKKNGQNPEQAEDGDVGACRPLDFGFLSRVGRIAEKGIAVSDRDAHPDREIQKDCHHHQKGGDDNPFVTVFLESSEDL